MPPVRDRDGKAWPWPDLLALVFDESRDSKKTWEERLSEPDREITDEHVYLALNFVADDLAKRTLLPREYEGKREQLLAASKRRGTSVEALKQRLPTRAQLETQAGTWDRALQIAELDPRPRRGKKAVGVGEAVLAFIERHGYLPAEAELVDEARWQGVSLKGTAGQPWMDVLDEAKRGALVRVVPEPSPYGTRLSARKGADSRPSERIPTRGTKYTRVQVLERVRYFQAALPPASSATNTRWVESRRGQDNVPSLHVIERHGGFQAHLREASLPDWRERAEECDAAAIPPPGRGRPRSDKAERLLAVIAERGEVSARELEEALSWPINDVRYYVRQLKKAGRIVTTHPHAQAKNQRYRPARKGE